MKKKKVSMGTNAVTFVANTEGSVVSENKNKGY